MGGFLGNLIGNMIEPHIAGSPQWEAKQNVGQRQQQLDIERQAAQRQAESADQGFADLVSRGVVKPSFHGMVAEEQPLVDSDDPGAPGSGVSAKIYRPIDKSRRITHTTADGQTLEGEVATPEEQMRLQAPRLAQNLLNQFNAEHSPDLVSAQHQYEEDEAQHQAQIELLKRNMLGVPLVGEGGLFSSDMGGKLGLNPDVKLNLLPSEALGEIGKATAPTINANARQYTTDQNNDVKRAAIDAANFRAKLNIQDRDTRQQNQLNFQANKAQNDQALRQFATQTQAAIQSGNPGVAAPKLRNFNTDFQRSTDYQNHADDLQQQIFHVQDLLDPETTPDGATYMDPSTGQTGKMDDQARAELTGSLRTLQNQMRTARTVAQTGFQKLGFQGGGGQPSQASPAGGAAPQNGATAAPAQPGAASPAAAPGVPAQGGGPAGGAANAAPSADGPRPTNPDQANAWDLVNHRVSPSQLKASLGGRGMQKSAQWNRIKAAAYKMDPDFNEEQADADYAYSKTPGFQSTVRYMDSVQESMPQLQAAADGLANGNVRSINALLNAGKNQFNNIDLKKFQADRALVGDEIAKILQGGGTGGGTSDAKLKQAQDLLSGSDSPQAIAATLKEVQSLIGYRRDSLTRGTYLEAKLPQGNGKTLDNATAQQFYKAAGYDPAKARQLAAKHGWKVPQAQ
jgi:hypothetical protein